MEVEIKIPENSHQHSDEPSPSRKQNILPAPKPPYVMDDKEFNDM